jgi:hypothetical protein
MHNTGQVINGVPGTPEIVTLQKVEFAGTPFRQTFVGALNLTPLQKFEKR